MPAADVVFASDAPPVAASRNANPSSPASSTAMSTKRAAPSFFSIGRCHPCPTTSVVTSGTTCSAQIRSISASASWSVSSAGARRSTWSSHRSATTFVRVPPWTTPTFTVTPGQRPLSPCSATIACAASSTALRPFSGSTPAWAARPVIVMR